MKQITLVAFIFFINFQLVAQENLKFDAEANFLAPIEIVGYRRPTFDYTRKLKRQVKRSNKKQPALPELCYTLDQLQEYNRICSGVWNVNDSLRLDSTLTEYKWRDYLVERLNYPNEAYKREITDSITVGFEIVSGQYLQNPILIRGKAPLLLFAVFDALKRMPKMKLEETLYGESEKTKKFNLEDYFKMIIH